MSLTVCGKAVPATYVHQLPFDLSSLIFTVVCLLLFLRNLFQKLNNINECVSEIGQTTNYFLCVKSKEYDTESSVISLASTLLVENKVPKQVFLPPQLNITLYNTVYNTHNTGVNVITCLRLYNV